MTMRPTVSVREAGKHCGLGKNKSYEAANNGELPVIRFGRAIRVVTRALEKKLGLQPGEIGNLPDPKGEAVCRPKPAP